MMKRYLFFFSMIAVLISFSSILQAQPKQKTWNDVVREYVKQHPENKGLARLMTALDSLNMNAVLPHQEALKEIDKNGWRKPYPEINQLIQSQSAALKAAVEAGELAPFSLPPADAIDSPIPNFLSAQSISRLLVAEARRLEAAGDLNTAAQRAVQALKFGSIFNDENSPLISHLIGIACMSMSLRSLESILQKRQLTKETAQAAGSALYKVDQQHTPVSTAFAFEKMVLIKSLKQEVDRMNKGEPSAYSTLNPQLKKNLQKEMNDFPSFEKEVNRVYDILIAEGKKPYWQQSTKYKNGKINGITTNEVILSIVPNFFEAVTRETVTLAQLRICLALCAKKMAQPDLEASIIDPFTGKPLMKMGNSFYSLGPDMTDQGGKVVYDPTNGTLSAGDIVERN